MNPKQFVSKINDAAIVSAIAEAEKKTSGEIRVYVSSRKRDDVLSAARSRFVKLGMDKTRQRNAVLIYFAPASQTFAIVGDEGIHQKCGQPFWEKVRDATAAALKREDYTTAVLIAIEHVASLLQQHFPPEPGDKNELPNQVIRD